LFKAIPTNIPSIVELKKALPKHCFQPILSRSIYFVVKDLLIVASLYAGIRTVDSVGVNAPLIKFIAYPIYWYIQVRSKVVGSIPSPCASNVSTPDCKKIISRDNSNLQ